MEYARKRAEEEINKLVSILKEYVPNLVEIKLFGSYLSDRWNENSSDIDIFALTLNEDYSCFGGGLRDNRFLIQKIREKINPDYRERFDIKLFTPIDLKSIETPELEDMCMMISPTNTENPEESRGDLSLALKRAKLIYKYK